MNTRKSILLTVGGIAALGLVFFFMRQNNSPEADNLSKKTEMVAIGDTCSDTSICETPIDYLIQSNCPFGAACIEGTCAVVCPITSHDPNPEISKSYPDSCSVNTDCNCQRRGDKTLDCVCLDGGCVSVEG